MTLFICLFIYLPFVFITKVELKFNYFIVRCFPESWLQNNNDNNSLVCFCFCTFDL